MRNRVFCCSQSRVGADGVLHGAVRGMDLKSINGPLTFFTNTVIDNVIVQRHTRKGGIYPAGTWKGHLYYIYYPRNVTLFKVRLIRRSIFFSDTLLLLNSLATGRNLKKFRRASRSCVFSERNEYRLETKAKASTTLFYLVV